MAWIFLGIAIIAEIIATSALKLSYGFTRVVPSLISATGYVVAFYFLALTLRTMPVGVAYAVWSGVGIVALAFIGALWFNQKLDMAGMVGIGLIVAGTLVLNLFSKTNL